MIIYPQVILKLKTNFDLEQVFITTVLDVLDDLPVDLVHVYVLLSQCACHLFKQSLTLKSCCLILTLGVVVCIEHYVVIVKTHGPEDVPLLDQRVQYLVVLVEDGLDEWLYLIETLAEVDDHLLLEVTERRSCYGTKARPYLGEGLLNVFKGEVMY